MGSILATSNGENNLWIALFSWCLFLLWVGSGTGGGCGGARSQLVVMGGYVDVFSGCRYARDERLQSKHSGSGTLEIGMLVTGLSLIRSLVRSHRSLIRSLARSCARGTADYFCPVFKLFWITVVRPESQTLSLEIMKTSKSCPRRVSYDYGDYGDYGDCGERDYNNSWCGTWNHRRMYTWNEDCRKSFQALILFLPVSRRISLSHHSDYDWTTTAAANEITAMYRVFLKKVLHKRAEKMQEKMKMT